MSTYRAVCCSAVASGFLLLFFLLLLCWSSSCCLICNQQARAFIAIVSTTDRVLDTRREGTLPNHAPVSPQTAAQPRLSEKFPSIQTPLLPRTPFTNLDHGGPLAACCHQSSWLTEAKLISAQFWPPIGRQSQCYGGGGARCEHVCLADGRLSVDMGVLSLLAISGKSSDDIYFRTSSIHSTGRLFLLPTESTRGWYLQGQTLSPTHLSLPNTHSQTLITRPPSFSQQLYFHWHTTIFLSLSLPFSHFIPY